MDLTLYQVDAFASRQFEGNPAAVCPLDKWLPDSIMQAIANENNLAETAFFVPEGEGYRIRWFTPLMEVDLCGHATLASAWVLFHLLDYHGDSIRFNSRSGTLMVKRDEEELVLDFPAQPPVPCETPAEITGAFNNTIAECLRSEDYIAIFKNEQDVKAAKPDLFLLEKLDLRGVIITASSHQYDFVARFFAPRYGIPEDPVTGSAYTQLAPYWENRLGSKKFRVKQLSQRGGQLSCRVVNDRVHIWGRAVLYMEGKIRIDSF